jgi:hypothetical protein
MIDSYDIMSTSVEINRFKTKASITRSSSSTVIEFANTDGYVPVVMVGLYQLDVSNSAAGHNIRVATVAGNVYPKDFVLEFFSASTPHSAGAMWFKVAATDHDFQSGVFIVQGNPKNTSQRINFPYGFNAQPKVLACISGFNISDNWRLKVYASDVDLWGFTAHLDAWGSTKLYGGRVTWIAFPADKKGVWMGTFTSEYTGEYEGTCTFPPGVFSKPPQVFAALNRFDIDNSYNLRVQLHTDNISTSGMHWSIETWSDTRLYFVGGTYLAVEL